MKIAVVGLWHLGSVTAACLAALGHTVVGFDQDPDTISELRNGRPPIYEPDLVGLIQQATDSSYLRFSSDPRDLADNDLIWITYDTPVDEQDRADSDQIVRRVAALFPYLSDGSIVIISSQVPIGSTRKLSALYRRDRPFSGVSFAYSPENLRLGQAITAFRQPERVVIGADEDVDRSRIVALFEPITSQLEWMSVESAEMTKHALNAFLATSITFANELAILCERTGADAGEVARGIKSDSRVGPRAYLRPGSAFAGGTLARDLVYLVEATVRENLPAYLLPAVLRSNDEHKHWPRRQLLAHLGQVRQKPIGLLGLTYKAGTNTLRRSAATELGRWLHDAGATVSAYDPSLKSLPADLAVVVELRPSIKAVLEGSEAIVIATDWPEFLAIRAADVAVWMRNPLVIDPGRFLEGQLGADDRITYVAVGRPR